MEQKIVSTILFLQRDDYLSNNALYLMMEMRLLSSGPLSFEKNFLSLISAEFEI